MGHLLQRYPGYPPRPFLLRRARSHAFFAHFSTLLLCCRKSVGTSCKLLSACSTRLCRGSSTSANSTKLASAWPRSMRSSPNVLTVNRG